MTVRDLIQKLTLYYNMDDLVASNQYGEWEVLENETWSLAYGLAKDEDGKKVMAVLI